MNGSVKVKVPERILVFPFDLMSHYLRCIELVKRYPTAEIFFASSCKYDHFVHEAGYKTFETEQFDADVVMACAVRFDFSWLSKEDIERVFRSQVEAIRFLKPTFVIGDTSPTLKMASEFTGVRYTALMNGYMSRYYALVRTLPRIHPARVFLSWMPPVIRNIIIRLAEQAAFRRIHRPFRRLRKKQRLRPVANYLFEMEGDENLLCDEPWLFPQKALPENYKIIGPLMYKATQSGQVPVEIPNGKTKILVCMGSSGNWEGLSFLSLPHYANFTIITAGDVGQIIKGKHVICLPFVSLADIVPNCAVLICHGGNGTVYNGIKFNIPMLCLTSHFEQEWNVQRLAELNLGVQINKNPKGIVDHHLAKFIRS